MNRHALLSLLLSLALLGGSALTLQAADTPAPAFGAALGAAPVRILQIPRSDLPKAVGDGVFLPLADLLDLARRAGEAEQPGPAAGAVTCTSLDLSGTLASALELAGTLTYDAPSAGWSATRIDDGSLAWTSQDAGGRPAFLARVGKETYLFARGPAQGTIAVHAMVPTSGARSQTTLEFGRITAPCRLGLNLGANTRVLSATVPVSTSQTSSTLVTVWPTGQAAASLTLQRESPLAASSSLRVGWSRGITAVGAALEVTDHLVLTDRFSPKATLTLSVPAGLRLLSASSPGAVRVETADGKITLTAQERLGQMVLDVVFAAEMKGSEAQVGAWDFGPAPQRAGLVLKTPEGATHSVLLKTISPRLAPAAGEKGLVRYDCWGPLPVLGVTLAPLTPPLPPEVAAAVEIARNEATVRYEVRLADAARDEFLLTAPDGWILTDLETRKAGKTLPSDIQQQAGQEWRAAWTPAHAPDAVRFTLRRLGAWGAPGTAASFDAPLVRFEGPRPARYDMSVHWPEEMDVRAERVSEMAIVPEETTPYAVNGVNEVNSVNGVNGANAVNAPARQAQQPVPPQWAQTAQQLVGPPSPQPVPQAEGRRAPTSDATRLTLRAAGASPSASFEIRGRDSDVQVTVVTSLSIFEDRALVRALLDYSVRFAPAHTFRFTLPAGTGQSVRIEGPGIRESSLASNAEGDEWTVQTQQGVLGGFALTLEWPLEARPGTEAVRAPQIRVAGVSAQRGFVLLEGSETLRLTAKTENLAEADLAEAPPLPWTRESRILGVYRYVEPPFALEVAAQKFQPEAALPGLAERAYLQTTFSAYGESYTKALYRVVPTADRQFFELVLPEKSQVWSVRVNEVGVTPASRKGKGGSVLMVPLPAVSAGSGEVPVEVIYRGQAPALSDATRLACAAPTLFVPVNRTIWDLYLPTDYQYLQFTGTMGKQAPDHESAAHFLRAAYYPSRILFVDMSIWLVLGLIGAGMITYLVVTRGRGASRRTRKPAAPEVRAAATARKWGCLLALALFVGIGLAVSDAPLIKFLAVVLAVLFLFSFFSLFAKRTQDDEEVAEGPEPAESVPLSVSEATLPQPPILHGGPLVTTGSGCASPLVALVVVLGVIAVLAAIAVPNFLEAQTRSKVARVNSDMRSLATGIEAYAVDYNSYPQSTDVLWHGPVSYITSGPVDSFANDRSTPYKYVAGQAAFEKAKKAGLVDPDAQYAKGSNFWMSYSIGPDAEDNGGEIVYDPSNGTTSAGDVIKISSGYAAPSSLKVSLPHAAASVAKTKSDFRSLGKAVESYSADYDQPATPAARDEGGKPAAASPAKIGAGFYNPTTARVATNGIATTAAPTDGRTQNAVDQTSVVGADDIVRGIRTKKPSTQPAAGDIPGVPKATPVSLASQARDGRAVAAHGSAELKAPGEAGSARYGMSFYDPSNGTNSAGDIITVAGSGPLGEGEVGAIAKNVLTGRFNDRTDTESALRESQQKASEFARRGGLLSLAIEVPQGGLPRHFETLGADAKVGIRLVQERLFKRIRFVVSFGAFLLMAFVWLFRRPRYRIAFVAGVGLTLILPTLFDTAWVAFCNAAFQGVLLSLLAPLLTYLWRRAGRFLPAANRGVALFLMATLAVLSAATGARAQAPGSNARAEVRKSSATLSLRNEPARILVPYDLTALKNGALPAPAPDAQGFVGRADFARLWDAAKRNPARPAEAGSILADVRFDGALVPERSVVEGDLRILAANPSDRPTTHSLRFDGISVGSFVAMPPGAVLQARASELVLLMPANWSGIVTAHAQLPCKTQGAQGSLHTVAPDAASGSWSIAFPWPDVTTVGATPFRGVRKTTPTGMSLSGPLSPGAFDLAWKGSGAAGAQAVPTASDDWRADVETTVRWANLASADWSAVVTVRSATPGQLVPRAIRLALDPALRLHAANGEHLRAATVNADGAEILLEFDNATEAVVTLEGVVPAPNAPEPWRVPGVRAPNVQRTRLRLEITAEAEVLALEPAQMERRAVSKTTPGYAVEEYESAAPDWALGASLRRLRPTFDAAVTEAFVPMDGFLRRAATVGLTLKGTALQECILGVPAAARVLSLQGDSVAGWIQGEGMVRVSFKSAVASQATFHLTASSDLASTATALALQPLTVAGSRETRRSTAVFVPADNELAEVDLARATPRPPNASDQECLGLVLPVSEQTGGTVRAYDQPGTATLRFNLRPVEAASIDTVFSLVKVGEERQTLDSVLVAEPRRGRLRQVQAMVLLAAPDPGAAARLQVTGPVRHHSVEAVSDRVLRVTAELNAPQVRPVQVRLQLDQPVGSDGTTRAVGIAVPVSTPGARAFLLLRRAFEGELAIPAAIPGVRVIDPASNDWAGGAFAPLPADQAFEIGVPAAVAPPFTVTRHERAGVLRAIVEMLRMRTVLTEDGVERDELDISLQNQSEQFLRIALPYPKDRITLYQTQVAGRTVKATFVKEEGKDVLYIPLLRTGLLDPEIAVHATYTVKSDPLAGSGTREQRLPDVLGDVEVAFSALVLMLPTNFSYSKFQGSLNPVTEADLETYDTKRSARNIERLSEQVRYNGSVDVQSRAAGKLGELVQSQNLKNQQAKQTSEAQSRVTNFFESNGDFGANRDYAGANRDNVAREQKLSQQRVKDLKAAELSVSNAGTNLAKVNASIQQAQPQQAPAAVAQPTPARPQEAAATQPEPPKSTAIVFPRSGETFVFSQYPGTGKIAFRYASLDAAGHRHDVLCALGLTLLAAFLAYGGRALFRTRRRAATVVFAVCVLLAFGRVALDVTLPLAVAAVLYLLRRTASALGKTPEAK